MAGIIPSWGQVGRGVFRQVKVGWQSYSQTAYHAKGMDWLRGSFGVQKGLLNEFKNFATPGMPSVGNYLKPGMLPGTTAYKAAIAEFKGASQLAKAAGGMTRLGAGISIGFRAFTTIWALKTVSEGLQKGGLVGGAKALAGWGLQSYAIGFATANPVAAVGAAVGVGAGAGYLYARRKAADLGRQYYLQNTMANFGSGYFEDRYGNAATMRRRSIEALTSSRIGGNQGLGNESLRSYQPYFR